MGAGFQEEDGLARTEAGAVDVADTSVRTARYGLVSVGAVALLGLGALASRAGGGVAAVRAALDTEKDPWVKYTSGKHGFGVYKYTIPIAAGSANNITRLVNATLSPTLEDCLGCDGVKVSGQVGPIQIHWVDASALDQGSIPVVTWQAYFSTVVSDAIRTGTWTAWMHNRPQLYTPSLKAHVAWLEANGVPVMRRSSVGPYTRTGYDGGDVVVGHAIFAIADRSYELAGVLDGDEMDMEAWTPWDATTECAEAMYLTTTDIDVLNERYVYSTYMGMDRMGGYDDFKAVTGFSPPMLLDVQVASSDAISHAKSWSDVSRFTNHSLGEISTTSADCTVARFKFLNSQAGASMGELMGQVTLTYVTNAAATAYDDDAYDYSIKDFDNYVEYLHETVTGASKLYRGWDHWLDNHVGFLYLPSDKENLDAHASATVREEARNSLREWKMPVGERNIFETNGNVSFKSTRGVYNSHFYTGKYGTMSWEFNVHDNQEVDKNDDDIWDICTCIGENNDGLYGELTGGKVCSDTCDNATFPAYVIDYNKNKAAAVANEA